MADLSYVFKRSPNIVYNYAPSSYKYPYSDALIMLQVLNTNIKYYSHLCLTGVHYLLPACRFPHLHSLPDLPYIISSRFPCHLRVHLPYQYIDLGYEVGTHLTPSAYNSMRPFGQVASQRTLIVRRATPNVYTLFPARYR